MSFAFIGLGNPGKCYCGTRHNIGYRVVERLSRQMRAGKPYHLRHSLCAAAAHGSRSILLVQPLSYMNLSGRATAELARRYHLEPSQMVLIHDDLDLPPGRIRLRRGGGSAGHRGVQSVIETMGTEDFIRLRIGIGKAPCSDAAEYVLDVPPPDEKELLENAVERAAEALLLFVDAGLDAAMSSYNKVI